MLHIRDLYWESCCLRFREVVRAEDAELRAPYERSQHHPGSCAKKLAALHDEASDLRDQGSSPLHLRGSTAIDDKCFESGSTEIYNAQSCVVPSSSTLFAATQQLSSSHASSYHCHSSPVPSPSPSQANISSCNELLHTDARWKHSVSCFQQVRNALYWMHGLYPTL